ncbi:MAG: DHHW family protein [Porcipelethomonas sp.]
MMQRKQRIISAVVFIIVILLVPLIFIISKEKSFSESENRSLAKKPELSLSALFDKSYMSDMDSYLSDQFPGRMAWVKTKMAIDRVTGREVINDIYLGDNMLIEKLPEPDYTEVNSSVQAVNQFAEHYKTKVSFLLAPTSAGIYTDRLPGCAPQLNQREFIEETVKNLDDSISVIDIYDTMLSEKENYIYYRTDHHWTSYGAYCAYRQASSQLGFSPVDYDKFDIEHASSDFHGTFYNKCFYNGVDEDIIDIYSYENGSHVTEVKMNDGTAESVSDSIYFRDYLDGNDKYCVFLGENRAYTNIRTDSLNKKKILVIKDSYANSFVPFLVNHYSEIAVVDLRYVKTSLSEYVNPDDYDQTLFLYNASTFSTEKNIKMAGFFQ